VLQVDKNCLEEERLLLFTECLLFMTLVVFFRGYGGGIAFGFFFDDLQFMKISG
jgi:hypothetical protein